MPIQWRNYVPRTLWNVECAEHLDQMVGLAGFSTQGQQITGPPISQMFTIAGSAPLTPGTVVAPYDIGWYRDMTIDKVAGFLTVSQPGVWDFFFATSGTVATPNSSSLFSLRLDGAIIASIESSQQQTQEGVEASISGFLRAPLGTEVVDILYNAASTTNITLTNTILSLGFRTPLEGVVEV